MSLFYEHIAVSGRDRLRKREVISNSDIDRSIKFNIYKCAIPSCVVPTNDGGDEAAPAASNRPNDAILWSNAASWEGTVDGFEVGSKDGDGSHSSPGDNTDVKIKLGKYARIDSFGISWKKA